MTHDLFRQLRERVHARETKKAIDATPKIQGDHLALEELVHELRQPLSTIEALTYYLELVCTDAQLEPHLQRIQDMVIQANQILERAATRGFN